MSHAGYNRICGEYRVCIYYVTDVITQAQIMLCYPSLEVLKINKESELMK